MPVRTPDGWMGPIFAQAVSHDLMERMTLAVALASGYGWAPGR
jgi:hypothetical protein